MTTGRNPVTLIEACEEEKKGLERGKRLKLVFFVVNSFPPEDALTLCGYIQKSRVMVFKTKVHMIIVEIVV